mgnify:CR=1 FL=1
MAVRRASLVLLALLGLAAPLAGAEAKVVPSAEQGSVPLLAEKPFGLESAVVVEPGGIAWREKLWPEKNVRLLDAVENRVRPPAPAVPAGTALFGYQLSSGVAYCAAADLSRATARAQCFRDFDQDGRFDGGYVTDWESTGSRYLAGYLHALGPAGKIRYERVAVGAVPGVDGHFSFVGFRKGQAQFRLSVEDSAMDNTVPCQPAAPGTCQVGGLTLKVEPQGDAARITLVAVADVRQIQITMTGASLAGRRR